MVFTEFEIYFSSLVNAGFPYVYIPSYEEERVMVAISRVINSQDLVKIQRKIYEWTQTTGLRTSNKRINESSQPMAMLEYIARSEENAIYVLKDFHVYFGAERNSRPDHAIIRKLRDIIPKLKSSRKTVVFISPHLVIPCDMEKEISILDFPLPNATEIGGLLNELTEGLNQEAIRIDEEGKQQLIKAALGLTMQEAENAFCRAIVQLKGIDRTALKIIYEEKNQIVKKTGVLEFVNTSLDIDDIGGLENLKAWLLRRNNTWQEKARKYNIPSPKGVLITGVPGCGKSLTAKAMSAIWNLPLLKLDMGKIFGGIIGSSEENIRKAISTAEAVAPSILWIDEIEKGFSGTQSSGDSGTSARVFGTFLTWMQDKTTPVFVIATANNINYLPPELLRKGRFDEIFFVDLPTTREREKIFALHLNKRLDGSDILPEFRCDDSVYKEFAAVSEGFTGSEIEQAVISALYDAFFMDRGLRKEDIIKAIKETVPISVTQSEQINSLRGWAAQRAVLATAKEDRENLDDNTNTGKPQGGRIVDFKF